MSCLRTQQLGARGPRVSPFTGLVALWALGACDTSSHEARDAAHDLDAGEHDAAPEDASSEADATEAAAEACEVTAPTSCPDPAPHYADVAPIFEERCLSCHDGHGEQWPLTTYAHVTGWYNEIRGAMTACTMPPADAGITMPREERELVLAWLRCGFPE